MTTQEERAIETHRFEFDAIETMRKLGHCRLRTEQILKNWKTL